MEKRNTFSLLFYQKKNNAKTNTELPLYMRVTINGKSVTLSLHRKISQNLWSINSGTAIGNTKIAKEINSYLLSVKSSVYENYKYLRETKNVVEAIDVKNAYLGIEDKGRTILDLFQGKHFLHL